LAQPAFCIDMYTDIGSGGCTHKWMLSVHVLRSLFLIISLFEQCILGSRSQMHVLFSPVLFGFKLLFYTCSQMQEDLNAILLDADQNDASRMGYPDE
jgi:hypothetical protein